MIVDRGFPRSSTVPDKSVQIALKLHSHTFKSDIQARTRSTTNIRVETKIYVKIVIKIARFQIAQ